MEQLTPHPTLSKNLELSSFYHQSNNIQPKKRESMKRRLSQQKSVQDLIKNMKIDSLMMKQQGQCGDENKNMDKKSYNFHKKQERRQSLVLQKIATLQGQILRRKYEQNPFLRIQIKHLTQSYKQNRPLKTKLYNKKSLDQTISYRQLRQMNLANQTNMLHKVMNTVISNKQQNA